MTAVDAAMSEPDPDSKTVVLVVEDEVLVRMMLVDVLEEAGFKVHEAAHADEALRILAVIPDIDVVVTDVEMPAGSLNGFDLARRIRAERSSVGVLIASGRAAPNPGELPEGSHFIAKPVHPETLTYLIRALLRPAKG